MCAFRWGFFVDIIKILQSCSKNWQYLAVKQNTRQNNHKQTENPFKVSLNCLKCKQLNEFSSALQNRSVLIVLGIFRRHYFVDFRSRWYILEQAVRGTL